MLSILRTVNKRPLWQATRTLSTSRFILQKTTKDKKPQSILTDDMLAKAGMDIDEPTSKDAPLGNEDKSKETKSEGKTKRVRQTSTEVKRE